MTGKLEARRARRRGVVAAAGAAAVAVVVAGTSYAGRGAHTDDPPPLVLETDAGNRAAAAAAASATLAAVLGYPGAAVSDPIAALGDGTLSIVTPGHTEVRSGFWRVSGVGPKTVARWYAAHPPAGFSSGGPGAVGGERDGKRWISEVDDDQPGTEIGAKGTYVEVETTKLGAGVGAGVGAEVGVRVTVSSVWAPARPSASYVAGVSSIDVRTVHEWYGQDNAPPERRSFTVTDPASVLHAVRVYDGLSGMTAIALRCPMPQDVWVDRIVFHTATGDVTVVSRTSPCAFGMSVHRDGHLVVPPLAGADSLRRALGLKH
jgi:hypothetical protein